jgi:PAS domain S-box-containing protein
MQSKASRQALKLALIYIIAAGGWILFSDEFLQWLIRDPDARTWISIYKGWAFVLVTGGLLQLTVRRLLGSWEREAEQRREITEKLRKIEERYQALFKRSLDCVFLNDFDGNFLDANQASLDLLGYQRQDIATFTFASLLTEDQLPLAFQTIEEIRTTGQQKRPAEFRLRGKDGREVHVEIRASLIYHDGKPFAIQGIARDLTLRKQAELALQESEEKYRSLFECSREAIMTLEPVTGRFTSVNPATLELFGTKNPAELFTRSLMDLSPERQPDGCLSAEKTKAVIDTVMREGSHFFEWTHQRISGKEFFANVLLTRIEQGGKPVVMATVRDITERKQAEEALHNREQRLRLMVEQLPVVAWTTDAALILTSVSGSALAALGIRGGDLVGQNYGDLFGQDSARTMAHRDALRGNACKYDVQVGSRDFETSVTPLRDAGQKIIGCVGVAVDITERKRAERRVADAVKYAQTLLAASPIGIITYKASGEAVSANEAAAKLIGTTVEQLQHQNFRELESWKQSKLFEMAERALATGQEQLFENFHASTFGVEFWSACQLVPFQFEGEAHLLMLARDISEQKRAEEALMQSEHKLRAILNASPMPMALSNEHKSITFLNPAFVQTFGYTQAEIPTLADWWPKAYPDPAYRQRVAEAWQTELEHVKRTKAAFSPQEATIRCSDGTNKTVLATATPLGDSFKDEHVVVIFDITAQRQAEAALRDSEERYRQIFAVETDAILVVDRETRRFIDANPAAERLYGYSREEFLRMRATDISAEPAKTLGNLDSQTGPTRELHHRRKDGTVFPVEVSDSTFEYQGRIVKVGAMRDVTERNQAEEALLGSEEQFRAMFELASIGMAQADPHTGRWLRVNQKMSAITGYSADELLGMRIPEITHSEDREKDWEALQRVVRGESPDYRMEKRYVRKDGTVVWVNVNMTVIRDAAGQPVRTMAAIEDITGRKRAEEQEQVQLSALTAAANAIVITDRSGKIEWVNPAFTKLTGYSAGEAIGGNLRMLKSGRHSTGFYANLWASIITGNVWHGEMVNQRKDGKLYTEEMTITPVRGAGGEFAHFVAIKQDVTERRELELRLQQAQKMEAIGTLAGGIAHDFNNILAAMFGYGYLLKQDVLEHPGQEYVGEILKAANRAKDLVLQILTFSRQREFKRHVIQMHTVVKEAIKFLRASMPAHIKIETHFAPDTPAVLADPTQIYQVVTNLATNALHAMEDRPGLLTVRIEPFQPDDAFLGSHPEFKPIPYARLTVADTGHGIDAGTLERIFEPFFTTKPVGKGTGLGLSVVHGILQAHEGAITVESVVGRGTTFALYFPGRTKDTALEETVAKNVPGGRGQTILLLDDEPALTTVLQSLLARLNYQVTTSNRARDAIGLCRENPARFDLVITDLTMPEMNGLEVARQIRALRPDMPVILTSGLSADLSREDLKAAGICELLKKPIGMNQLAEAVQGALINNDRRPPAATQPS